MKTCIFLALIAAFAVVTLVPAADPAPTCKGRNCKATPAQSDYTAYKPPAAFYGGDGQHGHHRHINVDIVRVLQVNPGYLSVYGEGLYDSTTQADILSELKKLGLRSDQIAAMLFAAARAGVPAAPGAPPAQPPAGPKPPEAAPGTLPPAVRPKGEGGGQIGLAVLNAKCAVCHQAGKLSSDQRFTLLDAKGNLATLTAQQKFRVLTKTYSQQMPPNLNVFSIPAVTDSEFAAIVDAMQ